MGKQFQISLMTGFVFMATMSCQAVQPHPYDKYCPDANTFFSSGYTTIGQCNNHCDGHCFSVKIPDTFIKVICCEEDLEAPASPTTN